MPVTGLTARPDGTQTPKCSVTLRIPPGWAPPPVAARFLAPCLAVLGLSALLHPAGGLRPFLPFADPLLYVLAPGGGFEAGEPAWTLRGGAAVVEGNEPFQGEPSGQEPFQGETSDPDQ